MSSTIGPLAKFDTGRTHSTACGAANVRAESSPRNMLGSTFALLATSFSRKSRTCVLVLNGSEPFNRETYDYFHRQNRVRINGAAANPAVVRTTPALFELQKLGENWKDR